MGSNRSSGRESGYDRNRMYGEAVLLGDLDFGDRDEPTTAEAVLVDRTAPGEYADGNTIVITNREAYYNRLAGQHVVFLMVNGELRPL